MFDMTFNGITKNYVTVLEKGRPYWAPINNNVLTVPGRPGGFVTKKTKEAKRIPTTLLIHEAPGKDIKETLEEVAEWLITEEAKKLVFSDEPEKYWLAEVDGSFDRDPKENPVRINVEFLCADPHKYGLAQRKPFESGGITLINDGTAASKPIFNIDVLQDTTFLQIAKDTGEYMQIGLPISTKDIVIDSKPTVLDQGMEGFDNWSTSNLIDPDEGTIGGNFASDSTLWYPQRYGENHGTWHGPMRRYDLPEPLDDFQIDVLWRMNIYQNRASRMGLTEFYLVGTNNKIIGKFSIDESNIHDANVKVNAEIRNEERSEKLLSDVHGYRRGSYNNFFGRVHLFRNGGYHWAQVGERQEDGSYANRYNGRYRDVNNEFNKVPLMSILVYAAQYKDRMPPDHHYIHHIKAFKLNDPQQGEVPYIAKKGDRLTVNHQNGSILINGEHEERLKHFGANYFSLDKGENRLFAFPEEYFDIETIYQDRYL